MLVRRVLAAKDDPREVLSDPQARYFGAPLADRTLVPGADATLGEVRFDDWLRESTDVPATVAATSDPVRHARPRPHNKGESNR